MQPSPLEMAVMRHCAPVLLGEKPAALFSTALVDGDTEYVCEVLRARNLTLRILRRRGPRALALVYHAERLRYALSHREARRTLRRLHYPPQGSLDDLLETLARNIAAGEAFPHEIGFFLGYPPEDVVGFIRHQGMGYKYSGQWKVYSDVRRAQQMERTFEACRQELYEYAREGGNLRNFCWASHTAGFARQQIAGG